MQLPADDKVAAISSPDFKNNHYHVKKTWSWGTIQ
jgi:hypothetical protein